MKYIFIEKKKEEIALKKLYSSFCLHTTSKVIILYLDPLDTNNLM